MAGRDTAEDDVLNLHDSPDTLEDRLRTHLAPGSPLGLPDFPDLPLAFDVAMPADVAATGRLGTLNGHVSIRLEGLAVSGVDTVEIVDVGGAPEAGETHVSSAARGGCVRLAVRWRRLGVDGRYVVSARPAPTITLDTAGTMLDHEADRSAPGGAGGGDRGGLDPEQRNAMIQQAYAERARLMDQPHGQRLLQMFNEHNETFNTVFVTSYAARNSWTEGGATRDMAVHTHGALTAPPKAGEHVNPEEMKFGARQLTYNGNAFAQQIQIVTNTASKGMNLDDENAEPDPSNKYIKACLAALTFGRGVRNSGNTKRTTRPMTSEQVHAEVIHGAEPEPSTIEELKNLLRQGKQDGGAAAELAAERNWQVLDEDDRRLVRRNLYLAAEERAAAAGAATEVLWEGQCRAEVLAVEATLTLDLTGERPQLADASVDLPAFEFELDDSTWSGAAADVARDRLTRVAFARSLLRERLQTGLGDQLAAAVRSLMDVEE